MSSITRMKQGRFTSVTVSLLLAGCAANPYVQVPVPRALAAAEMGAPVSIGAAIKYADDTIAQYRAARSAEFDRQQNVSGTMFGLGALALGLGAYKAHSDAIVGVGLAGATTYQLGMWNTAPARNSLYSEGIHALACAQEVMAPVLIGPAQYARVENGINDVRTSAARLARASAEVYAVMATQSMDDALRQALQVERDAARKQSDRADQALARAGRFQVLVGQAGSTLKTHVDFVREGVDKGLNNTLADPRHLPDAIRKLADYSTFFSATPSPAASDPSRAPPGGGLKRTGPTTEGSDPLGGAQTAASIIAALPEATAKLRTAVSYLDNAYVRSSGRSVKTALEGCNIDPAAIATALQVTPAELELTALDGRESAVRITEGTGFYRVRLLDLSKASIAVTQPDGSWFRIIANAASSEGSYRVLVEDQSNAHAIVTVRVVSPQAAGAASTTVPDKQACSALGRSALEICLAQKVLQIALSGTFDKATCDAFRAYPATAEAGGVYSNEAVSAIKNAAQLPAAASAADMKAKIGAACPGAQRAATATAKPPASPPAAAAAAVTAPAAVAGKHPLCVAVTDTTRCQAPGAVCMLECDMSKAQVGSLRVKLQLQATPEAFDSALRQKIVDAKLARQITPANAEYTPEFAHALYKR